MKKLLALLICMAFAMTLFAACGDDETYRQPGNGTTLGGTSTTPVDDNNGSYSADPDGDVNQTTDNNILEDGLNDIEDGIEHGINDIEQGMDNLENGAEDIMDGNDNADINDNNVSNNDMNGANGAGMNENGVNGVNQGDASGATNGNAH